MIFLYVSFPNHINSVCSYECSSPLFSRWILKILMLQVCFGLIRLLQGEKNMFFLNYVNTAANSAEYSNIFFFFVVLENSHQVTHLLTEHTVDIFIIWLHKLIIQTPKFVKWYPSFICLPLTGCRINQCYHCSCISFFWHNVHVLRLQSFTMAKLCSQCTQFLYNALFQMREFIEMHSK